MSKLIPGGRTDQAVVMGEYFGQQLTAPQLRHVESAVLCGREHMLALAYVVWLAAGQLVGVV